MTMNGFTIDDVRDTLTRDVTRFLGRIETTARDLCDRRDLAHESVHDAVPLFQTIGDHGHAIFGTTSLVAADSLSSSASAVERLAMLGRDDLARAARHLERARRIAAVLADGATEMLAMLSLELDERSGDATKIADGWRGRVEEMLAANATHASELVTVPSEVTAPPPPAKAESFGFDDGWSEERVSEVAMEAVRAAEPRRADIEAEFSFASVGEVEAPRDVPRAPAFSFAGSEAEPDVDVDTGAIDVELALIFQDEAHGTFKALTAQLAALAADPSDRSLYRELERSYHTLKGAAATVGLAAVSAKASELQQLVELLFESTEPATPQLIASLESDTAALRAVTGVEASAVSAAKPPSRRSGGSVASGESFASALAVTDDVRLEFERESRALLEQAEHILANIAAEPERSTELVLELAKSLHRLKGSAFVVGASALGQHAEQLEQLCAQFAGDASELAAGLSRCGALLGESMRGSRASSSHDEMRSVFLSEARTIGRQAKALVPTLRDASDPAPVREELRRLMHRLKGSAMVVFESAIAREATALHDALEGSIEAQAIESRLAQIGALLGDGSHAAGKQRFEVPIPDPELEAGFQQECAELLDVLDRNVVALERSERPKEQLSSLLGTYHTLKGAVNAIGLAPTGDLVHRVEDLLESLHGAAIIPPLRGVVSLLLQIHAEIRKHLKTVSLGYVDVTARRWEDRIHRVLAGDSRMTSALPASERRSGLGEGSEASRGTGATGTTDSGDRKHIRVSIDRLDALMNLAGELVINRSRLLNRIDALQGQQSDLGRTSRRLTEIVERFREEHEFSMVPRTARSTPVRAGQWGAFSELELDRYEDVNILARTLAESSTDMQDMFGQLGNGLSGLADDSDALGTIISGMQTEITRARMVPLGSLFSRLQLPIRDAAEREHREVRIITDGEEVHLDKTIADALLQPMLHLVRNAVSHGLESSARRSAAGKPLVGTLRLSARQELGQITVVVSDDGAGLDLAKLHARGVAMGLIPSSVRVDDPIVKDLVFAAGLSTSPTAGAVAGRGVGCDIVRRNVERLNGAIRVDSVPGRSTTFSITLPLTLAISRALLLRHGEQTFAVPLNFIERIIDVQGEALVESAGRRRIELEDGFVNVRTAGEFLAGASTRADGPVVILRVGEQRLCIQVDAVTGQEEVVVKGLGALLTGHPMFAGVTIRGTGEIVLILDAPSIVETALVGRTARVDGAVETNLAPVVEEPRQREAGGKFRVLFVDDSVSVRKVAQRALEALGVSVTLAVDGVDALEKLHTQPFDLVFTDLEMPRMHGYELIRELRFLPAFRSLPVVVVTSRSGKKHREEAHAVGATHYMTKPFSPQSLEAAINKFGRSRDEQPGSIASEAGA